MAVSRRERTIALGAGLAVVLLMGDRYFLTPLLNTRERVDVELNDVVIQLEKANRLFARDRLLRRKWSEVTAASFKPDASAAESQLLHSLRDWAQEAGLQLATLKPEQTEAEKHFQKLTFRATATGGLKAVTGFLWRIHTSGIPGRMTDVQITSRKEGTDDLALDLRISTLCPVTGPAASAAAPAALQTAAPPTKDVKP